MADISEAAKAKAKELLAGVPKAWFEEEFARFIQQASDAAKEAQRNLSHHDNCTCCADEPGCGCGVSNAQLVLEPFILPDPVDPLQEALHSFCPNDLSLYAGNTGARVFLDNLAKRGLKIVEAD